MKFGARLNRTGTLFKKSISCIVRHDLVGWWFWVERPFKTVFQSISGRLPESGWSGGAMVLGKLPVPGRPTIWIQ